MTKVRLYALGTSTTLESNKSVCRNWLSTSRCGVSLRPGGGRQGWPAAGALARLGVVASGALGAPEGGPREKWFCISYTLSLRLCAGLADGRTLGGGFRWRGVGNRVDARRRWKRSFDFPILTQTRRATQCQK